MVSLGEGPFPEEALMRALAGELKHSETAFVRRAGERSFHIRYFTPAEGQHAKRLPAALCQAMAAR